ncbi:MAG: hypothetical protein IPK15_01995 [Verrucomicrobia bacterium]|nr:hypothetical protein [Verrucomicrobiota bacterium]
MAKGPVYQPPQSIRFPDLEELVSSLSLAPSGWALTSAGGLARAQKILGFERCWQPREFFSFPGVIEAARTWNSGDLRNDVHAPRIGRIGVKQKTGFGGAMRPAARPGMNRLVVEISVRMTGLMCD